MDSSGNSLPVLQYSMFHPQATAISFMGQYVTAKMVDGVHIKTVNKGKCCTLKLCLYLWTFFCLDIKGDCRLDKSMFKGDLNHFPSVYYIISFAYKRSWNLKRSKSTPTEAPFSHRKPCSWNASSEVPPLIPWLCDITLRHHVSHLHNYI